MAPEYMTVALSEISDDINVNALDPAGVDALLDMARDVLALGPGLGQAPATKQFVKMLVDRATMPLVIDADGLNAFSDDPDVNALDPAGVDALLDMARDVLALGPGLGQAPATKQFVKMLVDRATMPLVIDADGLNAFSDDPDRLAGREGRDIIITPHPGEMARLVGMSTDEVQSSRLEIARNFAVAHYLYVVLKGHRTLIATPDEKVFINSTGNAGMATGGTGDVLTGMIAAWLGQLLDAEAACKLAVYLHGMAGDLAEADEGDVSLIAGDLVAHIGDAIQELTARRRVVNQDNTT
ncbi:MAG: NAD(P)H-hydrate dehydratase [Acidobacteria bacterium]|nr:MAG: NAD(P)H-hydrate dehydratase [Acidobacteriota bacterium]